MRGIAAPNPPRWHGPPVALLVAACSGGSSTGSLGVANVASSSARTLSSPGCPASHGPLAFSRCRRVHGVTDFPGPGGPIQASLGSGLDPSDRACQATLRVRQPVLPTASPAGRPDASLRPAQRDLPQRAPARPHRAPAQMTSV